LGQASFWAREIFGVWVTAGPPVFCAKTGKEAISGTWFKTVTMICCSLKNSVKISGVFGKRDKGSGGLLD
jgi:hypothetical protein